jgi:hypothetical protein
MLTVAVGNEMGERQGSGNRQRLSAARIVGNTLFS